MRPYLVFLDDDPQELRELGSIVSADYDYLPVEWPGGEPVRLDRMPDIIVLDLYFPSAHSSSVIPTASRERQQEKAAEISVAFAHLYDEYQDGRELLRKTFGGIRQGYELLSQQCEALGQSAESGMALLARIRANREFDDIPIVFYSRKATVEEAVRALQAGAFTVIPKPPSPPSLEAKEAVLAKLALAREQHRKLVAAHIGGALGSWNINITVFKQEIVAQKLEFTIAKVGG
jgi:CheY-like chemotaxis protein